MRVMLPFGICCLAIAFAVSVSAGPNSYVSWTMHYAGSHDAAANTCDRVFVSCWPEIDTQAPEEAGSYDIYVIATTVYAVTQTRFALASDGPFIFEGWTGCADSEITSAGWPGSGEDITLLWDSAIAGPHVTLGILDVYSYGSGSQLICTCPIPSLNYAEVCDGTDPTPVCEQFADVWRFGCIGFSGYSGYNSCEPDPVDEGSWGAIKALYR